MRATPLPTINRIGNEILRAIDAGFCYLALSVTLTLPDVCVALTCDPKLPIHVPSSKYKAWVRANVKGTGLTEEEFYALRCGVLHNARKSHPKLKKYRDITFTLPVEENVRVHNMKLTINVGNTGAPGATSDTDLILFLPDFSRAVVDAAKGWLAVHKGDPNVAANLPYLITYREKRMPIGTTRFRVLG